MDFKLSPAWSHILSNELEKDYIANLKNFLQIEKQNKKQIFPAEDLFFNALNIVQPTDIKVVILGQDPYHGIGQAHGLAFSVEKNIKIPPSLRNIYKELENDLGIFTPNHGNLLGWAQQGVLLLNTVLSVESGAAGSHQNKGWEQLTDAILCYINNLNQPIVFMLWGGPAQKKEKLLSNPNHLILKTSHPSPLSAYRGFLGCRHFSQANVFLKKSGSSTIDWSPY